MATLTEKQKGIYTELIKEYNKNDWQKIASLDRFIQIKVESALNRAASNYKAYDLYSNLCAVQTFAENDF